jgi:hypothetical protein
MTTISDEYRAQQVELHMNPNYGVASIAFAPIVAKLIVDNGIKSLSDYGAGKKNLQRALEPAGISIDYRPYDPAFPEYGDPQEADLVACIDVLEHIEPACLDAVLDDLVRIMPRIGFLSVHTGAAVKVLSDGRNAHLIQEPARWWLPRLCERFHIHHLQHHQMMGQGFWVVVSRA